MNPIERVRHALRPEPLMTFASHESMTGSFPEPLPAFRAAPAWWRSMPRNVVVPNHASRLKTGTARECAPFGDAIGAGYVLRLPVALEATTREDGYVQFSWPDGAGFKPIGPAHNPQQLSDHSGHGGVYKMLNPWCITTPPGYSTLFMPLANAPDNPFRPLSAVVETDAYTAPVNFPFTWHADPGYRVIDAGYPVVQVIPFRRERWTHEVQWLDDSEMSRRAAPAKAAEHRIAGYRRLFHAPKVWK